MKNKCKKERRNINIGICYQASQCCGQLDLKSCGMNLRIFSRIIGTWGNLFTTFSTTWVYGYSIQFINFNILLR